MRSFVLFLAILFFSSPTLSHESRVFIDAGVYKKLSNTVEGEDARFEAFSVEVGDWSLSRGEFERVKKIEGTISILGQEAKVEAPLPLSTTFLAFDRIFRWGERFYLQGNIGLAILDKTSERLSTLEQFHMAAFLGFKGENLSLRFGLHHLSNGSRIFNHDRDKPNRPEEFISLGIGLRLW